MTTMIRAMIHQAVAVDGVDEVGALRRGAAHPGAGVFGGGADPGGGERAGGIRGVGAGPDVDERAGPALPGRWCDRGSDPVDLGYGLLDPAAQLPADLEQALGFVADAMWAGMQRDHAVLRVLLRDLDAHPDLLEDVWTTIRDNVYDVFTAWLRAQADAGTIALDDPEATGAVLLASLTYRPILDAVIGHTPGDVDATRYRAAWIRHALATLTS